jgi:hypothetical protein
VQAIVYCRRQDKEPRLLATDLEWGWRKVVGAHELRMSIEELFRNEKNLRFGWGPRRTEAGEAGRLERLLLAFACLLLVPIGKSCRRQCSPSHWASAVGRRRQASNCSIRRCMQVHFGFRIAVLMGLLADALRTLAQEG